MVSDHLSDFVTRIRNGYQANLPTIEAVSTRAVQRFADVLVKAGYLQGYTTEGQVMTVTLKYTKAKPAISGIKRVSKPGARIYAGYKDLPRVWGGLGMHILSTPQGVMTDKDARKLHCGGELIAQVW